MEFNKKLQELRKSKGLTQEALAEALFVSRTAVSKWESGRGYPGIDSLKAISRFFSVTIDEMICSEEIAAAAEKEKEHAVRKIAALLCGLLNILTAVLLFLPVYGDGKDSPSSVSIRMLTNVPLRSAFILLILTTVVTGLCGILFIMLEKTICTDRCTRAGIAFLILCTALFILARQPYAGFLCFAFLITEGILITASGSV